MSVTSTASQIRGPCVRSNARKLGRPIILPLPIRKAMRADDPHRSRAPPPGFGLAAAAPQSPCQSPRVPVSLQRQLPPQQTSPLPLREHASSSRKTANREYPDHDRTPQQFGRSQSARKPTRSTSPTLPFARASSLYTATRRGDLQDGVYIAFTKIKIARMPRLRGRGACCTPTCERLLTSTLLDFFECKMCRSNWRRRAKTRIAPDALLSTGIHLSGKIQTGGLQIPRRVSSSNPRFYFDCQNEFH